MRVLPADAEMTSRVQALGYVKGESMGNTSFLPPLMSITGHEFHYSRVLPDRDAQFAFRLTRGKGIDSGKDGLNIRKCSWYLYSRLFYRCIRKKIY